MKRFEDQIDQDQPSVSWESSPVIRMTVVRSWVRLARLHPPPIDTQEPPDDDN